MRHPIRNKNTRIAYYHAIGQFLAWCERGGFRHLEDIEPITVAAYIEQHPGSAPTIKQHMAAIRMFFSYLTEKGILALGNCQSVVNYLGAIRNKIGDAHGQGKLAIKPKPRHAELVVNLAGTMASFLVSTWDERQRDS